MTSVAKRRANKLNATNGTGPKTIEGRGRVRLNALKHGLFATELLVKEAEKPEYAALQTMLYRQYAPSTAMRQIGFQRILWCAWRLNQSFRLEMRRLNAHFDLQTEPGPVVESMEEKTETPRWYGWGRSELNTATKMLSELRADIKANGWIHADQWKERLTKIFAGDEFYNSLSDWSPGNIQTIRAAKFLTAHAELTEMPLPAPLGGGSTDGAVIDPSARWEMMIKIVELKLQQLSDFRLLIEGRGGNGDSQSAASFDVGSRYFTTAGRDLERAVVWYEYLKQQGL